MQLVCPSKHAIFLDTHGESYSDSFSGTIHLDEPTELSLLNLSLMQTILLDNERHPSGDYIHEQRHPKKWFQRHKSKEQRDLILKKSSVTTEVLRCNLSTSPTSNEVRDHGFSLSIPCDIPASIRRPAFNISYELVASATTTSGHNLTTHQTMHISRLKIPDPHEVFRYVRTFPETRLRAEFILCPQLSLSSGPGCKRHISAQLLLRDVATLGPRHGEQTMVVVKELTWRVDEIEKWNTQQTESGSVLTRQKRTIATGNRKGRCTGMKTSTGDIGATDVTIAIPFDITIDSSADALNSFTSEHPQSSLLAVKHRLEMTIVTGSETFNRETGLLVDKRDTVRILGAAVPIPVYEYAKSSVISERLEASDAVLPQYYGCSGSPPGYSN